MSKLYELIEHFEGLKLKSYKCSAGIWTIGVGTTVYPDNERVKEGDVITKEYAYECLRHDMRMVIKGIDHLIVSNINDNQRDALISFAYNLGIGALQKSTLLKKVNVNPDDITIQQEFEKWVLASGHRVGGLVRRRKSESWLYFKGELNFYP